MVDERVFYEELLSSISYRNYTTIDDSVNETDVDTLFTQIKSFQLNLISFKQNQIYIYCLIGRNFKFLQNNFKKNPCKGKFITLVEEKFPNEKYSKSYIYFLIKLYKTTQEYNKLAYTSFPLRKILSNFKLICKLIEKDKIFWKDPPLPSF